MKRLVVLFVAVISLAACDKNKIEDPEPSAQDTNSVAGDAIDTYDKSITEENADLIFSYSQFYHPNLVNSANTSLQRTAVVDYLKNGKSTYFNNKVYLNDTLIDFLLLESADNLSKYKTVFNKKWIQSSDKELTFDFRTGNTLANDKFVFSNQVPDTFTVKSNKMYLQEGNAYTFSLSKIPQGVDSIFISLTQYDGDVEVYKEFGVGVANSFSFTKEEINQIATDNYTANLMVSTVKFLSANKNGKKVYASFVSQVDYELEIISEGL